MVSPWSPPGSSSSGAVPPSQAPDPGFSLPAAPPVAPPTASGPSARGRWTRIWGAAVVLVCVIAATAAITYAVTKGNGATPSASPTIPAPMTAPAGPQPQYSPADQAAAKQRLCQVFDVSTRGQQGHGGVRNNGELNVPVVLRGVGSIVGVQAALSPATPPEVASAAKRYIDAEVDLNNAALGNTGIDELKRLNDVANAATDGLADACGLPH